MRHDIGKDRYKFAFNDLRVSNKVQGVSFDWSYPKILKYGTGPPQHQDMVKSYTGPPPMSHKPVQNLFKTSLKQL